MRIIKYLYDQICTIKYQISTIDLALPAKKVMSASFFFLKQYDEYMLLYDITSDQSASYRVFNLQSGI